MNKHKILSVMGGLSLFSILFFGSMLGILADKQEKARPYFSKAGTVKIELSVNNDSDEAIMIEPNQLTPLEIHVTNKGSKECYVFIKLDIPEINGHPILVITPTENWQKISDDSNIYQYVVDGIGKALSSGEDTQELVYQARFYDFTELPDFSGELKITAYAVQTNGFDDVAPIDTCHAAVQATGGE